jgi:hypothetical protein
MPIVTVWGPAKAVPYVSMAAHNVALVVRLARTARPDPPASLICAALMVLTALRWVLAPVRMIWRRRDCLGGVEDA